MIKVNFDNEALAENDLKFLQEWAEALNVSLDVLLGRILAAAAVGKHYLTGNPAQSS